MQKENQNLITRCYVCNTDSFMHLSEKEGWYIVKCRKWLGKYKLWNIKVARE